MPSSELPLPPLPRPQPVSPIPHPLAVAVLACIALGSTLALLPLGVIPRSVEMLAGGGLLAKVWALLNLVGSLLMLRGTLCRQLVAALSYERAGAVPLLFGSLAYGVAALAINGTAGLYTALLNWGIAAGAAYRLVQVTRSLTAWEREMREYDAREGTSLSDHPTSGAAARVDEEAP